VAKDQSASNQSRFPLDLASLLSWSGPSLATDRRIRQAGFFTPITGGAIGKPTLRANKLDWVRFSLADDPSRPGLDGIANSYGAFLVRDGAEGDLDGRTNGAATTTWRVPSGPGIPSALGATVTLTAQEVKAGNDRIYGTADDRVVATATTSFRDASVGIRSMGVGTTIDETKGNQNGGLPVGSYSGDLDDNDITIDGGSDQAIPDFPQIFASRLIELKVDPNSAIGSALSGYNGGNLGLESFTVVDGASAVSFVGSNGQPLSGLNSKLNTRAITSDVSGFPIFLYTDPTNDNIVLGRAGTSSGGPDGGPAPDPVGKIVFAAYIEETISGGKVVGGKIWTIQFTALEHSVKGGTPEAKDDQISLANLLYIGSTAAADSYTFANAPSGQNLFLMLGNGDGSKGIVVTGKAPADQSAGISITKGDRVNTSQGGGPTTIGINNQMIDPPPNRGGDPEGVYFTFVTSPKSEYTVPNLDQNEADLEKNIQFRGLNNVQKAGFTISQTQPAQKASTLTISARFTSDGNTADNGKVPGDSDKTGKEIEGIDKSEQGTFISSDLNSGYNDDVSIGITEVSVKAPGIEKLLIKAVLDPSKLAVQEAGGVSVTFKPIVAGSSVYEATISGVKTNYSIEYVTQADHNRVLITNTGNADANLNSSFDVGAFTLPGLTLTPLEIGSTIRFEDDGPTIQVQGLAGSPTVKVYETNLGTAASASFAGEFKWTPNFGTDGPGVTELVGYSLGIKAPDSPSGLVDVASGQPVNLYLVNGTVVGRAVGNDVFTVSVDATGVVTLKQHRALRHDPDTTEEEYLTLPSADFITLSRTEKATDWDGDSSESSGLINIARDLWFYDDVPMAVEDSNVGTASETNLTLSGNLISNDIQGADGAGVVGASLPGRYGSIVIQADGSYIYTLDAADADFVALLGGATATETFSYTLRDGDGDESTAQLILNIKNEDNGVTITGLTAKAEGGDVSVNEDDLPAGSDASKESTTQGGTFRISAPDGVNSLTIGGLNVISNGVFAAVSGLTALGNTLSITGYDGSTGEVSYSYRLNDNEAHASVLGTNSLFEDLTVLLKDRDGDDSTETLSVNIVDDVPLISTMGIPASLTVDDTTLSSDVSGSFAANFNPVYGADGPGSIIYALGVKQSGITSGLRDTLTNEQVTLQGGGSLVQGVISAGIVVFEVSVDGAGVVTLDQKRSVVHSPEAGPDQSTGLSSADLITLKATIQDNDGDTAFAILNIADRLVFKDDAPTPFTPAAASLQNAKNAVAKDLNLDTDADLDNNTGADQPGFITFTGIANGQQATGLINGVAGNLTSGGQNILLYLADHDSNPSTPLRLEGRTESATGPLIYTVTLNPDVENPSPSTDHYRVDLFAPIGDTTEITITNFSNVKSGNNEFASLDITGTTKDLLFSAVGIGRATSTVNVSQTGLAVGNQSIDDGETLRVDFVNNVDTGKTGPNSWYNYDMPPAKGHYNVNNFQFNINQVNTPGGGGVSDIETWIRIYNADDDDPASGTAGTTEAHAGALDDDGLSLPIREVWVYKLDSPNPPGPLPTPLVYKSDTARPPLQEGQNGDANAWLIPGLDLYDRVVVYGQSDYSRIEIENARSDKDVSLMNEAFDIGRLGYVTTVTTTPAVTLNYTVNLTDADGDSTPNANLAINLTPTSTGSLVLAEDPITGGALLSQAELKPVAERAIQFWQGQGVNAQSLETLRSIDVVTGSLDGRLLGQADPKRITLDGDGAGHGWSSSFDAVTPGQVDLYSALVHEYGHVLGYNHDLLGEQLPLGMRHLPTALASLSAG
jgi:VCBS repeat-containing protein